MSQTNETNRLRRYYDAVRRVEEDPTGLLNEGFRYRDLETGVFITRDPVGNTIMMPKEKWMVDGREVSYQEYEVALEPGVPQAGSGPSKTAKDSGQEADAHVATSEAGGSKNVWHTAAAGFPNLYTYVNENPWTFFDPEGLDAQEVSPGNYRFVVNPANFGQTTVAGVASAMNGTYVAVHGSMQQQEHLNGQCATGAQYLTGTREKDGFHDAPSTRKDGTPTNWNMGAAMTDKTPRGTMVAWGWDANGHYPSQPSGNHTAIYMGPDSNGNPQVLEQNHQGPGSNGPNPDRAYQVRSLSQEEAKQFHEVNSRQKCDPRKSTSYVPPKPQPVKRDDN